MLKRTVTVVASSVTLFATLGMPAGHADSGPFYDLNCYSGSNHGLIRVYYGGGSTRVYYYIWPASSNTGNYVGYSDGGTQPTTDLSTSNGIASGATPHTLGTYGGRGQGTMSSKFTFDVSGRPSCTASAYH